MSTTSLNPPLIAVLVPDRARARNAKKSLSTPRSKNCPRHRKSIPDSRVATTAVVAFPATVVSFATPAVSSIVSTQHPHPRQFTSSSTAPPGPSKLRLSSIYEPRIHRRPRNFFSTRVLRNIGNLWISPSFQSPRHSFRYYLPHSSQTERALHSSMASFLSLQHRKLHLNSSAPREKPPSSSSAHSTSLHAPAHHRTSTLAVPVPSSLSRVSTQDSRYRLRERTS